MYKRSNWVWEGKKSENGKVGFLGFRGKIEDVGYSSKRPVKHTRWGISPEKKCDLFLRKLFFISMKIKKIGRTLATDQTDRGKYSYPPKQGFILNKAMSHNISFTTLLSSFLYYRQIKKPAVCASFELRLLIIIFLIPMEQDLSRQRRELFCSRRMSLPRTSIPSTPSSKKR